MKQAQRPGEQGTGIFVIEMKTLQTDSNSCWSSSKWVEGCTFVREQIKSSSAAVIT